MNKAVIFDWGGVLMRTAEREPRYRWDRRLGLLEGGVEGVVHGIEAWRQAQRGEVDIEEYWEAVAATLKLTPSLLTDLRKDFYSGDKLDEGLIAFIRELSTRGILVGLLSNYSLDLVDMLAAMQIDGVFDALVISAQIGILKPDPGAYEAVLCRLGVAPEQALFVDDSLQNVEGAISSGMTAIHFVPGINLQTLVEGWLSG